MDNKYKEYIFNYNYARDNMRALNSGNIIELSKRLAIAEMISKDRGADMSSKFNAAHTKRNISRLLSEQAFEIDEKSLDEALKELVKTIEDSFK